MVSHQQLIHNMKKQGIPHSITSWLASFLKECHTMLSFDDYTSKPLLASFGIPQGSPLSPILFLFYLSDLLEVANPKSKNILIEGFINNTAVSVVSHSIEENIAQRDSVGLYVPRKDTS